MWCGSAVFSKAPCGTPFLLCGGATRRSLETHLEPLQQIFAHINLANSEVAFRRNRVLRSTKEDSKRNLVSTIVSVGCPNAKETRDPTMNDDSRRGEPIGWKQINMFEGGSASNTWQDKRTGRSGSFRWDRLNLIIFILQLSLKLFLFMPRIMIDVLNR
ncbi:hypothetical protein B0J14DRAFT_31716 [Halenospora varia]|nr:hypothetical protein B0J14DRAFT_31716 [Halenospora varia]